MTIKRALPILGQPDPVEPRDVHLVGRYALGITWGDGHSSIYPFPELRRAAPAPGADEPVTLTEAMTWPRQIKRRPEALRITWADGQETQHAWPELRGSCPCAGCHGGH